MAADEALPGSSLQDVQAEFERSRESSVRLLEALKQKVGGTRAVRQAANSVQRAAEYVQSHPPGAGVVRFVRRRPLTAALAGVAAGFLLAAAVTRAKRRGVL